MKEHAVQTFKQTNSMKYIKLDQRMLVGR